MKKGKSVNFKNAKHSTSQSKAVTFLKVMPMWQRVVCAIMAVLLVFLLWPANAAKTIVAWGDAAAAAIEEASSTEEVVTPEGEGEAEDPGGTTTDTPAEEVKEPQAETGEQPANDEEPLSVFEQVNELAMQVLGLADTYEGVDSEELRADNAKRDGERF